MPSEPSVFSARGLLTCLSASAEAGRAILEVYASAFSVEIKDDKSPLTEADRRSHAVIMRFLRNAQGELAGIPVLSEEGKNTEYQVRKEWEYFWLVDPLDGTKEFIKRNGEFTVNIALIHRGRPVLSVVHIPVRDLYYFAAEGIGAYRLQASAADLSGAPDEVGPVAAVLRVMDRATLLPDCDRSDRLKVVGSRSHGSKELEDFVEVLRKKHGELEFIAAGSSLKFCLVAEGKADMYPRFGPTMEWDTAAGQAVVECSGGSVKRVEGETPLTYNKENLLNPWFIVRRAGL